MAINKVIFGGNTIMDISDTTATADKVESGSYFYTNAGVKTAGTSTKDSDTTDATASADEILLGETAYVNKNKITGTMPNNGSVTGTISTKDGSYTIPQGFHDGGGSVQISQIERQKLIPSNIKAGISLLSIEGSYTGEGASAQSKTVIPDKDGFTVLPDTNYDYLSQVVVNPIPYVETQNAYGTTVAIG